MFASRYLKRITDKFLEQLLFGKITFACFSGLWGVRFATTLKLELIHLAVKFEKECTFKFSE